MDGGIKEETIRDAREAGANSFVAGSAVFIGDIPRNVRSLLQIAEEYQS